MTAHERGWDDGYSAAIHDARIPGSEAHTALNPNAEHAALHALVQWLGAEPMRLPFGLPMKLHAQVREALGDDAYVAVENANDILTEFPVDKDGNPLAWPDPVCPSAYVDAWNGIYDSREFALAESRDWVATEDERKLAFGSTPVFEEA